ncbi:MAG: FkbM family methyltransferase [Chloroflexota bacterium]
MQALKSRVRQILNPIAKRLGYIPQRERDPFLSLRLEMTLRRVFKRDLPIQTVIDVGAAIGEWTDKVHAILPNANYLLIEANDYHEDALKQYVARTPNSQFALVAASDQDGSIYFDNRDPFGGVAAHDAQSNYVELPARSIDSLIEEYQLPEPYLLKLDTHGFEVPILEGANKTLEKTNLLIIEAYNFQIQDDSLLFYELCRYMREKGFRVADFSEPLHRKYDQMLWQMDIFFIKEERPEFEAKQYS